MQTPTHDLARLRERALPVLLGTDPAALACARLMVEPARQMSLAYGDVAMRDGCAHLATGPVAAWPESLRREAARSSEAVIRAALAFWATETDPATWLDLVR